jgi:hypothetical protein
MDLHGRQSVGTGSQAAKNAWSRSAGRFRWQTFAFLFLCLSGQMLCAQQQQKFDHYFQNRWENPSAQRFSSSPITFQRRAKSQLLTKPSKGAAVPNYNRLSSNKELDQLERASQQVKVPNTGSRSLAEGKIMPVEHEHNAPINFSYQKPRGK